MSFMLCGANRSAELTGNTLGSCKTGWHARISKGRERPLPRLVGLSPIHNMLRKYHILEHGHNPL